MRTKFFTAAVATALAAGALATGPSASADDGTVTLDGSGSSGSAAPQRSAPTAAPRAAAGTPVTVGQTGTASGCTPGDTTWIQASTTTGTSYVVPGPGVITSFSHQANSTAGSFRAVFLVPAAAPNDRTVVAFSPLAALVPNTLNTVASRIPVPAGASLGIHFNTLGTGCVITTAEASDVMTGAFLDPSTSSAYTPGGTFNNARLNLSAVWEPDVDNDHYGDVSQDACPQSALTQAACPAPETTITKRPAKTSSKRKATIKFTSAPGATFTCAVDGKAAKACTSPFKKHYRYGKHTVVITATSSVGIPEATPEKVKFKIRKPG